MTDIGTITFQRASGKLFHLKYVVHVTSLKNNLISVAMLEDRGYDVVFSEGKKISATQSNRASQEGWDSS